VIQFTTTNSALPAPKRSALRARRGMRAALWMQEARESGFFWGALALAVLLGALVYAGSVVAHAASTGADAHRRMAAMSAARNADGYYTEPRCVHIRDLPLRKAFTQADIDRLCINPRPRRA